MKLFNSNRTYGLIAVLLHWIVAIGFLGAYVAVYYRHWFTVNRTPENLTALQLHLAFGITVGVFVVLRIVWTLLNTSPAPVPGPRLEQFTARTVHMTLFAAMIIMPLTGYFGSGAPINYFFLIDLPKFEETALFERFISQGMGLTFKEFEVPIDFVHKKGGAYLVWILIALHAGAALYHHIVRKDDVLKRMLPVANPPG